MASSVIENRNIHSGYGSSVNLNSYTGSNRYTIPSDGVVEAYVGWEGNQYMYVMVDGGPTARASTGSNNKGGNSTFLPVFKVQRVHVEYIGSSAAARFYPFA